jgi:plasmid stabilization system protein ParE
VTVRFTRRAEFELDHVAEWSREMFDPDVADAYIEALRDGVAMAERVPGISKEVRGRDGVRRILRGRHWIYSCLIAKGRSFCASSTRASCRLVRDRTGAGVRMPSVRWALPQSPPPLPSRRMFNARIFLCRFVRSTPSTTLAREMFQS